MEGGHPLNGVLTTGSWHVESGSGLYPNPFGSDLFLTFYRDGHVRIGVVAPEEKRNLSGAYLSGLDYGWTNESGVLTLTWSSPSFTSTAAQHYKPSFVVKEPWGNRLELSTMNGGGAAEQTFTLQRVPRIVGFKTLRLVQYSIWAMFATVFLLPLVWSRGVACVGRGRAWLAAWWRTLVTGGVAFGLMSILAEMLSPRETFHTSIFFAIAIGVGVGCLVGAVVGILTGLLRAFVVGDVGRISEGSRP